MKQRSLLIDAECIVCHATCALFLMQVLMNVSIPHQLEIRNKQTRHVSFRDWNVSAKWHYAYHSLNVFCPVSLRWALLRGCYRVEAGSFLGSPTGQGVTMWGPWSVPETPFVSLGEYGRAYYYRLPYKSRHCTRSMHPDAIHQLLYISALSHTRQRNLSHEFALTATVSVISHLISPGTTPWNTSDTIGMSAVTYARPAMWFAFYTHGVALRALVTDLTASRGRWLAVSVGGGGGGARLGRCELQWISSRSRGAEVSSAAKSAQLVENIANPSIPRHWSQNQERQAKIFLCMWWYLRQIT